MRIREEKLRRCRSVQFEFLEERSLLSTLKPAVDVGPSHHEQHTVPLKIEVESTSFDIASPSGVATAQATHLGRSTYYFTFTSLDIRPDEGRAFASGTFTLVGANGKDAISGTWTEVVTADDPADLFGPNTGVGTYTITGGTGRFGGASGEASVFGKANPTEGVFTLTIEGIITAPHAA